ncbi:MAG TPA: hypothetical protein VGB97_01395 [Candidatus Paceibacterota bacterium]|jgi:hypothetical protein
MRKLILACTVAALFVPAMPTFAKAPVSKEQQLQETCAELERVDQELQAAGKELEALAAEDRKLRRKVKGFGRPKPPVSLKTLEDSLGWQYGLLRWYVLNDELALRRNRSSCATEKAR